MTNGYKIRNQIFEMSDEGLVREMLRAYQSCSDCPIAAYCCESSAKTCVDTFLEWLKEEARE